MPIRDKFFLWPYELGLETAVDELTPVLEKTGLRRFLHPVGDESLVTGNLAEFIAFECRTWNVNPWWLMICAQREQSLLGRGKEDLARGEKPKPLSVSAEIAWLGLVGQQDGRARVPGYYGVYQQVSRCAEQTAWLMGVEPAEHWPELVRTGKAAPRWRIGRKLSIQDRATGAWDFVTPQNMSEWVQYSYTTTKGVVQKNEQILQAWVPIHRR